MVSRLANVGCAKVSKLATNWDALVASAPLNKQAALDASAKGGAFVPRVKFHPDTHIHAEIQPKIRKAHSSDDLTGRIFGRLKVLGLADLPNRNPGRKTAWVVQCICGRYENRKAKGLKDGSPQSLQCAACLYKENILKGKSKVEFPKITVSK
jgi:hypothetical protein